MQTTLAILRLCWAMHKTWWNKLRTTSSRTTRSIAATIPKKRRRSDVEEMANKLSNMFNEGYSKGDLDGESSESAYDSDPKDEWSEVLLELL